MGSCLYVVETSSAVALAVATPKAVIVARANTTSEWGLNLRGFGIGFNGVTAANTPVLVELFSGSGNAGTPGTILTPRQLAGRTTASGMSNPAQDYSVDPSGLVVIKEYLLTPNGGDLIVNFPADKMPDTAGEGVAGYFGLRCTAAQIVSLWAYLEVERT